MSYDVSLYFPNEVFPIKQWQSVIAEFNPQQHEVKPINPTDKTVAEWTASRDGETSWLRLCDVSAARYCKPTPAHWAIYITRAGHSPRSVWLQFAVCYHALVLMNNVVFNDGQFDVTLSDEAEFLSFASERLSSIGTSKTFKLGLTDAKGKPLF